MLLQWPHQSLIEFFRLTQYQAKRSTQEGNKLVVKGVQYNPRFKFDLTVELQGVPGVPTLAGPSWSKMMRCPGTLQISRVGSRRNRGPLNNSSQTLKKIPIIQRGVALRGLMYHQPRNIKKTDTSQKLFILYDNKLPALRYGVPRKIKCKICIQNVEINYKFS